MLLRVGQYHFFYSNNGKDIKSNASFSCAPMGSCLRCLSSDYLEVVMCDNLEDIHCILYSKTNRRKGDKPDTSTLLRLLHGTRLIFTARKKRCIQLFNNCTKFVLLTNVDGRPRQLSRWNCLVLRTGSVIKGYSDYKLKDRGFTVGFPPGPKFFLFSKAFRQAVRGVREVAIELPNLSCGSVCAGHMPLSYSQTPNLYVTTVSSTSVQRISTARFKNRNSKSYCPCS
jgi:hypothetical protein